MDMSAPEMPQFSFEDFPLSIEKREMLVKQFDERSRDILVESCSNQDRLLNAICHEFKDICAEIEEDVSILRLLIIKHGKWHFYFVFPHFFLAIMS